MRHFIKLIEYEKWANLKVYEAIVSASETDERALELFSHLLNINNMWLNLILEQPQTLTLWEKHTIKKCKELILSNTLNWTKYLSSAENSDTEKIVEFTPAYGGEKRKITIRDAITGIIIHSAYHRGQIILRLKPLVKELPLTTYPSFASFL